MKIFRIVPFWGFGGAEIMCENLIYKLSELGHEVVAISLYDYDSQIVDRLKKHSVKMIFLEKKSGLDLSIIKKLIKLFKQEKPDVVHTHLYVVKYVMIAAIIAGVKKRVHTVHSVADKELGWFDRKLNKIFVKRFDLKLVALSETISHTIEQEYKISKSDVPVVLNGIDLTKCMTKSNYDFEDNFKIIHIGSFQRLKNHIGLVDAFEMFHSKYKNTELHLIGLQFIMM